MNILSKLKASYKKENKKRLVWGLHPMAILADMAAWKQVFRIHDDNPDRTSCRPISIKILHCVAEKKRTACFIKSKALGLHAMRTDKEHRAACWMERMKRIFIAMWTVGRSRYCGHTYSKSLQLLGFHLAGGGCVKIMLSRLTARNPTNPPKSNKS